MKKRMPGGTPEGRQRRRWRQASLKNSTSKLAIAAALAAREAKNATR